MRFLQVCQLNTFSALFSHHRYPAERGDITVAPLVFLAPLAGLAALYAMAYVNSNPALLSLVAISGRKKRSLSLEDRIAVGEVEEMDYMNEVGKTIAL